MSYTLVIFHYLLAFSLGYQSEKCKPNSFWFFLCFGFGLFNFVYATATLAMLRFSG